MATQVLNYTSLWTETDPNANHDVSLNETVVTTMKTNDPSWVVRDLAADVGAISGDFTIFGKTEMADWVSGTAMGTVIALQDAATGTPFAIEAAAGECVNIRWQATNDSTPDFRLRDADTASQQDTIDVGEAGTPVWWKLTRVGNVLTLYVYSDAARTTEIDNISINPGAAPDLRYVNAGGGWHTSDIGTMSFTNSDLDLQFAEIVETGRNENWNVGSSAPSITHGLTVNENDIVLVEIHQNTNGATITDDNGGLFTKRYEQDTGGSTIAYFDVKAGASFPATPAFSSTASSGWKLHIRVYSGVHADIWAVPPSAATENTGTSTTATAPSIAPSMAGCLGLVNVAVDGSFSAIQSAPTNGYAHEQEDVVGINMGSHSKDLLASGAVGSVDVTLASSRLWMAHHMALKPASASGGGVGSSTGSSTGAAVSAATKGSPGTSVGVAVASGVGAAIVEAVGASVGSSAVSGVGEIPGGWNADTDTWNSDTSTWDGGVLEETEGSSVGVAVATGVGVATAKSVGTTSGVAAVTGQASVIAEAVGASVGAGTVSGLASAFSEAVASSDGVSAVSGAGDDAAAIGSDAVAAGSSVVTGVSSYIAGADAVSTGTAVVAGVSIPIASSVGASTGVAVVSGVGEDGVGADAESVGLATVLGQTQTLFLSAWASSGVATVAGLAEDIGVGGFVSGNNLVFRAPKQSVVFLPEKQSVVWRPDRMV